jgi:8-amino-7-oxononanoate synthase/acyl carrier protein
MNDSIDVSKSFEPYFPSETNLVDRLRFWTLAKPDDIAFRFLVNGDDECIEWTYQELDARARAIAAKLLASGMYNQRALLMFQSGLDFISAFFGCLYAKVIPVPAFPPRRNRNMGRVSVIADDANAAVALTTRSVIERLDGSFADAPTLSKIPWLAVEEVPLELAGDWVNPEIRDDDIAFLQYTSGSTGSPKGVILTHANVLANARMITHAFELTTRSAHCVSWLPLYHDMGLVGGILAPAYVGGWATLMSPVSFLTRPIRWLRAISKYRGVVNGGPNFAYAHCTERIRPEECDGLDLSCWELAFNGAEPVRADVLNRFTRKFAPFGFEQKTHYPCYGMAETTLLVTGSDRKSDPVIRRFVRSELDQRRVVPATRPSRTDRHLVSSGTPVPGTEVLIVDPETRTALSEDQIGEIWINGPSVGRGYWQRSAETNETYQARLANDNGKAYLRTGDLGFLNHGQLFVTGRIKDMIIVHGVNRYPQDIEASVENISPRLRAGGAAAFAFERDDQEQLVVVCEVERDRANTQWGDVIGAIRSRIMEDHELPPDAIVLVRANSVPKTSSGKVQRQACLDAFLEGRLLIVAQWYAWDDHTIDAEVEAPLSNGKPLDEAEQRVVAVVISHVRDVAKERAKKIDLDTNIVVDLGLDSLERLNIAAGLERAFGGRIPDEVLQEVETIREVAQAVLKHIGSEPQPAGAFELPAPPAKSAPRPIPDANYEIEKMPEFTRVQRMKELLHSSGIRNPFFSVHQGIISDTTRIDGRKLISFSSYNYLGLSGHPEVSASAKNAIDQYGTSVSASRLVSGEKDLHKTFEAELADFLGFEDVITFAGGHATNESVIGHLVGPGDLIIHDALAHNSIVQGAELSGARRRPFDHSDWRGLDHTLAEIRAEYRRVLIAIEGLYSMDGDIPNLPKFIEIKNKHKAWLYLDEAHSIGTLGKTGRGLGEWFDVPRDSLEVWMGTLSKSLGSCGGFIGGSARLVEYLRYTTPGFVYAAGLPPPNVGAALGALRILRREPQRVARLAENAALFLRLAQDAGLNTGLSNQSPIIPVITGDSRWALRLSEALFHAGINAQPILHPAVEEKKSRLRFFITSEHTEAQIRFTVDTVANEFNRIVAGRASTKKQHDLIA